MKALLSNADGRLAAASAELAARAAGGPCPGLGVCPFCREPLAVAPVPRSGVSAFTCDAHGSFFDRGDVARVNVPAPPDYAEVRPAAARAVPPPVGPVAKFAPAYANPPAVVESPAPELATRGSRFAAHMLDGIFLSVAATVAGALGDWGASSVVFFCVIGLLPQIFWAIARGQTFGKRLSGVRVVGIDGQPASPFRIIVLRNFVPYFALPLAVLGFALFFGDHHWGDAALWETLAGSYGLVWGFSFFDHLAILGEQRRALHDYIAGTIVVRGPSGFAWT